MSDHAIDLDPTGHCIAHPQIRVRRPNPNGIGYRIILTNGCPLCAIEPVKPRRSSGNNQSIVRRDSGRRRSFEEDFGKSFCSASDITETTVASSQSSSSCLSNLEDFHSNGPLSPVSERKRVICGMRYQDPRGRIGTYTGQVDAETQFPHGIGCLRLGDGEVLDGEWSRGHLISEESHHRSKEHARHPSRSRAEHLSESLRSCRLDDDESIHRHPSRSRRESLSHSTRFEEEPQEYQYTRSSSRCRRESLRSLSRSCRFYEEDEDANSIENHSLGSHGEHTVATYSARESKRTMHLDKRPSRGHAEVKH